MGIQERKAREKQARQEAILKAAQKVFFAKGLDQTTIDDIAAKAELSKGTLYLYFKSKEDLYISVFLRGLDLLTDQFQQVQARLDSAAADELIRASRDIYYAFFMEYPEYFYTHSLLYSGRIKDKIAPELWTLSHQKMQSCLTVIAEIIRKGMLDGMFHDLDCWKTANSFWGAATGVMMLLTDEDHQKIVGAPAKELLDYTIEQLLAGLKCNHATK